MKIVVTAPIETSPRSELVDYHHRADLVFLAIMSLHRHPLLAPTHTARTAQHKHQGRAPSL